MSAFDTALNSLTDKLRVSPFSRTVVFRQAIGGDLAVRGIFDSGDAVAARYENTAATLWVRVSDFMTNEPKRGDRVVVDGMIYLVFRVDKGSANDALCLLREEREA
jgi:hypothetical protein